MRTSDGKASVPACQPDVARPVFGVQGRVPAVGSLNFVTRATRDGVAPELPAYAPGACARKESAVLRSAELPMPQRYLMF
ncbi:hypothetical protein [Streptomyces prunicolor]